MNNDLPINNSNSLCIYFETIIRDNISNDSFKWLQERLAAISPLNNTVQLQVSFSAISRKIEKKTVQITAEQAKMISIFLPGLSIKGWTLHRLCRAYILLALNAGEKIQYCTAIESLFINAEMNERADIYASLPLLEYSENWIKFCVEGIRSNIGIVQESIMYNNPFPAKYLEEAAWNQMVLKAFFTDKNINLIIGIDERANAQLASTLIDYAQERKAAKRLVNNQLWRPVTKFINDSNFSIIEGLFLSENKNTRLAAALACMGSTYFPAKILIDALPEIKKNIIENNLNWSSITA